jgi:Fe-S-cluster containining protein
MCCRGEPGFVWVRPDEIGRMAERLDIAREEFTKRYVRRDGLRLSLKERANGDCVLWNDQCRVYEVRPAQCRNFPFWRDALRSRRMFDAVVRGCPGIGEGKCYSREEIEACADGRRDTDESKEPDDR